MKPTKKMVMELDELRAALLEADEADEDDDEPSTIVACRGPDRCEQYDKVAASDEDIECPWCYQFRTDDPRSSSDLLEEMMRTN